MSDQHLSDTRRERDVTQSRKPALPASAVAGREHARHQVSPVQTTVVSPQGSVEIEACPAKVLLREWAALGRPTPLVPDEVRYQRGSDIHQKRRQLLADASQVAARSNVGAAFQLLISITAWPWGPEAVNDPSGISDEAMNAITDGTDYKRRLEISAYLQISRDIADVDLRDAERWLTAEHIDGGGIMQWLREAQSTIDFRKFI